MLRFLNPVKISLFVWACLLLAVAPAAGLTGGDWRDEAQQGAEAVGAELRSHPGYVAPETPALPKVEDPIYLRINLPAARLDLFRTEGNQLLRSYPVGIGMPRYPTPIRDYNIHMIIWNPWWVPPDSDWAQDSVKTPPGPANPLGVVKMMMEDGIRIHGTNAPRSIGWASSHACLRMKNEDARELAWEIQRRYSEKTDPTLLDIYGRNRRSAYYVPLFQSVPVVVDYLQVERMDDRLLLHPNRYGLRGFEAQLREALSDRTDWIIDRALVKKLDKMRGKKTVELKLEQLQQWASVQSETPEATGEAATSSNGPL